MAKRNADKASSPAVWERLLGVLFWALQGQIWISYISTLVVPAGFVCWLLLRKRGLFLSRVSARLLQWWLVVNAGQLAILIIGLLKGIPGKTMEALLGKTVPIMVASPQLIPLYWRMESDPAVKVVMAVLLGATALNMLVSLYGIGVALLGRPRQPQAESAPVPEAASAIN